jgi:hypothetical protein
VRENAAVIKLLRRGAVAGLLGGIAVVVWRMIASRTPDTDGMTFTPAPFPSPPRPVPAERRPERAQPSGARERARSADAAATQHGSAEAEATQKPAWVEPEDGACPVTHPVKAKITSGIFHLPGGLSYERTRPDRCYVDAAGAESDGLRPAKR